MVPRDPVTPGDRPPFRWGRRIVGVGLGLGAVALFRFLSSRPELADQLAGAGPLPALTRSLSVASGLVPLPIAELVVVGVVGRQALGLARGVGQLRRGEDRLPRATLRGGARLAQDAGGLLCLFVLLWGIHHARPGLEDRLGIDPAGEVSSGELALLANEAVATANRLYFAVHGTSDAGTPTPAPSRRALLPEMESAWERVAVSYGLPARSSRPHGPPKAFLAGLPIHRFGLAGMYFPFTGEVLVLRSLPGVALPRALGHEMAHQRGFASESDANVLAFLVARETRDPLVAYSGYVFLQRQLVAALSVRDPAAAFRAIAGRSPGVQRDVEALADYWRPARGWTRKVSITLNHFMLRAHGVPGGIASYRGSTWVFTALAREHGLEALLLPEGSDQESEPS